MKFTINADKMIFPKYRLIKDGTFRDLESTENVMDIQDEDQVFDTYQEAKSWMNSNDYVVIEGEKVEVNPGIRDMFSTVPNISIYSHRTHKPSNLYFTKEDVKEELKKGDNEINNVLIVDWDGKVKLIPFVATKDCAVRIESFHAGTNAVGSSSALNHLEDTYLTLLEAWLTHLKSEGLHQYRDYPSNRSAEEIINEIKEIKF